MNRCVSIWNEEVAFAVDRIADRIRRDESVNRDFREAVAEVIEAGGCSSLSI